MSFQQVVGPAAFLVGKHVCIYSVQSGVCVGNVGTGWFGMHIPRE